MASRAARKELVLIVSPLGSRHGLKELPEVSHQGKSLTCEFILHAGYRLHV
jgi:hypothetical protein